MLVRLLKVFRLLLKKEVRHGFGVSFDLSGKYFQDLQRILGHQANKVGHYLFCS
jgi:hypothetical protein